MGKLPSTGVTMGQVAEALGYRAAPLCLSYLCKHPNVNKWSKWKPIIAPYSETIGGMTDRVLKWHQYGFDMGTNKIGMKGWSWGELMASARANDGSWKYDPPTGGTYSPYRLGDFRNYNPDAEPPYTAVGSPGTITAQTPNYPTTVNKNWSENVEITMSDMDLDFDIEADTFYMGVLYCSTGSTTAHTKMIVDTGTTLEDFENGDGTCSINIPFTGQSAHYDVLWVCTTVTDPDDPEQFSDDDYTFYLPNTLVRINYDPLDPGTILFLLPDEAVYINSNYTLGQFNFHGDNSVYPELQGYMQDIYLQLYNSTLTTKYYGITVELWCNLRNGNDPYQFDTLTYSGSTPARTYKNYPYGIHVEADVPGGDTQTLEDVGILIYYRQADSAAGVPSGQRRYVNILTDQLQTTNPGVVSFQDIINCGRYHIFLNGTEQN